MKTYLYCIIFFILQHLFLFSSSATAQYTAARLFTAKDGLASSYVFSSYQDKLGYLWVCTNEGLSRYDGHSFTNYGLSDGLPGSNVVGAYMDDRRRLWVYTPTGIATLGNNHFTSYPFSNAPALKWVYGITQIRDGRMLALTSAGIFELHNKSWSKIVYYPAYQDHLCVSLLETTKGTYISYGDILVLKRNDNSYRVIGKQNKQHFFGELSQQEGKVWITTLQGVMEIADEQLVPAMSALEHFQHNYVFLYDHQQRLWTAESGEGVQKISDPASGNGSQVYKGPPEFLVQSIQEDALGNIWLSTGNGLLRIAEENFEALNTIPFVGNKVIRNVLPTGTGSVLVNDGSLSFKEIDGAIIRAGSPLRHAFSFGINEFIIDAFLTDEQGRDWYFTRDGLLLQRQGNQLINQTMPLTHPKQDLLAICYDGYRKRVSVAMDQQLYPCYLNGNKFKPYACTNELPVAGPVTSLLYCNNKTLLFAKQDGQLYGIDSLSACHLLLHALEDKAPIKKLLTNADGNIWIYYAGHGLRCYSWQSGQLVLKQTMDKSAGLMDDVVRDVCFDKQNSLWVATRSGVTVFAQSSTHTGSEGYALLRNFSAQILPMGEDPEPQLQADRAGNVWFFTKHALLRFAASQIHPSVMVPAIQIESVELNLQATDWHKYSDSVEGLFALPVHLRLSHDQNAMGFSFKGIHISGAEDMQYSYQLKGFSTAWSVPSDKAEVSFVGLPPGQYVFSVKARFNEDSWSAPAHIAFEIGKPFWKTYWFDALVILSTLLIFYGAFWYRLAQKTKIMEMRNQFSRDLHDEIGASVSGIHLLSQMAAEKMNGQQASAAEDYVQKIKNYSGEVVTKLSDMVWIFNPQNDSLQKLTERLKSFALTLASSKDIVIDWQVGELGKTRELSIQERKAIYLISKEAIINAVKHGRCKSLHYSLEQQGTKYLLCIQDDGHGFKVDDAVEGNGVRNMRSRAAEIGAQFDIWSSAGLGTRIKLLV